MSGSRPFIPVLIVTAALSVVVGATLWHNVAVNDGHVVFSLDDPYIHLAMARNLAAHGTWGINAGQFSASSSAPLFTLILAVLFAISGPTIFWSWFFAIVGSLVAAAILTTRAARVFPRATLVIGFALWAVVLTGLPEMMFNGMEHGLHIVLVLLVAALAQERLAAPPAWGRRDTLLVALVIIAAGIRYESLYIVLPLVVLLYLAGRRRVAAGTLGASLLPAVVLGIVQVANGAMLLPNTVLLKGLFFEHHGLWGYVQRFWSQIDATYWWMLVPLGAVAFFVTLRRGGHTDPRLVGLSMFLFSAVCQSTFGHAVHRYAGYLVALGIWALLPFFGEWLGALWAAAGSRALRAAAIIVVATVLIFPFGDRFSDLGRLPLLGRDIYLQQYQMARFFSTQYAGQGVGLNDIGMVSWFGGNRVLDLWGLGNNEVMRLTIRDRYRAPQMREIAERAGVDVIAVYPGWFVPLGGLPDEWRAVHHWQVPTQLRSNVGSPLVFFFATRPEAIGPLQTKLKNFLPELPPVIITGF